MTTASATAMTTMYSEYRTVRALARPITLAECPDRWGTLQLLECPAGYYPAGSRARHAPARTFLATWRDRQTGATHGQHYTTYADARDRFVAQVARAVDAGRAATPDRPITWHICPVCGERLPVPVAPLPDERVPCTPCDTCREP